MSPEANRALEWHGWSFGDWLTPSERETVRHYIRTGVKLPGYPHDKQKRGT